MYIHHLCSSSSLEFYIFVFSFASFLLFFLQEYLLGKKYKAKTTCCICSTTDNFLNVDILDTSFIDFKTI